MSETIEIRLPNAQKTATTAGSLGRCLTAFPVTIRLQGPLGAGKTTWCQGLARGLGVTEAVTSPTFALEQRYPMRHPLLTGNVEPTFAHLDLYRLDTAQAAPLLHGTEHCAVRCIEWSERLGDPADDPHITVTLAPDGDGRRATVTFADLPLPNREDVERWRTDVALPSHIVAHCDAVASLARTFATALIARGDCVRPEALTRAAELHDLLRFLDFQKPVADPPAVWQTYGERYGGHGHEHGVAQFLREHGFAELGTIVAPHGLPQSRADLVTTEQLLLFYADKRLNVDRVVSVAERFAELRERYADGKYSALNQRWETEVLKVEALLFPDGPPA